MEVTIVNKNTIRIKGKTASFIVDPDASIPKTSTDGVLFLSSDKGRQEGISKISDQRVVIEGPGSYEVGGVRITSQSLDDKNFYLLIVDGISIFMGKATGIEKQQEKGSCNVLILNVDGEFKESMISAFEPNIALLYGEGAQNAVKILGKEYQVSSKFSQTADKLPAEMQVVLLK